MVCSHAGAMHVPNDLANRLIPLAEACGCSPEEALREALTRWIVGRSDAANEDGAPLETTGCSGISAIRHWVPQPRAFSVYE